MERYDTRGEGELSCYNKGQGKQEVGLPIRSLTAGILKDIPACLEE
jgi:hypothetical protein